MSRCEPHCGSIRKPQDGGNARKRGLGTLLPGGGGRQEAREAVLILPMKLAEMWKVETWRASRGVGGGNSNGRVVFRGYAPSGERQSPPVRSGDEREGLVDALLVLAVS